MIFNRGFTEVGGRTADHLQKVELAIIDNNKCRSLYDDQENYNIDDTQLCAGELAGGKDTCQVNIIMISYKKKSKSCRKA